MPNPTVPAAAPGLPADHKTLDPVVALITAWREACTEFAARPKADGETWNDVYGWLSDRMNRPPSAQSLDGAIAALEFALAECSVPAESSYAASFVNAALGFLKTFSVPVERPATRAEMEAYRAWLAIEGRILARELYPDGGPDAERVILAHTGTEDLHLPASGSWKDMPKPSSRAVRVLTAVGANFGEIARCGAENDKIFGRATVALSEGESAHG